jgi:hypothetical protein
VQAMLGQSAAQASGPSSQPIHTNPFSAPSAQVVPPTAYAIAPVHNPFLDPVNQQQQSAHLAAQTASGGAMTNVRSKLPIILSALSLAAGSLSTLTRKE